MPIVFQEKINRKLPNNNKVVFNLSVHSEDFERIENEGCYTCNIKVYEDNVVLEYYRLFPIIKYKKQHYSQFIDKFCKDEKYREQFNTIHDKIYSSHKIGIDDEIKDVIFELNKLGLKTQYSCQGTKNEFSDRPHMTDGHSVNSYIIFEKKLPSDFIKIINMYDIFLKCNESSLYSTTRNYNKFFHDLMMKSVDEYKLTLEQ